MTGNIVSRRYAKALFSLGQKRGGPELEAYGNELSGLADVLKGAPEALRFFKNPSFSPKEKKAVMGTILDQVKVDPTVRNFCDLLADKGRLDALLDISSDFGAMLDEAKGVLRGSLTTAKDLSAGRRSELKKRLEEQTGRKLELDFATDPEILGGVVLRIGDKVLDASLRAQLQILKETIKRGE
ncbi:MAG: ATP synthase F1 subunit delta [Desulfovibrionaceae bacterium]|nr:F0F1 ATP synthase subunit delta [Desulfovibrionaceae bacterium]MDD4951376.1 ATP synthase F1 subunit delta [Desulfovibrionaceae bacterium]